MPTDTEVEAQLRKALKVAAETTPINADWERFTERMEQAEGTLPTLQPLTRRNRLSARPTFVLGSAFAAVVLALGLLAFLSDAGDPAQVSDDVVPSFAEQYAACAADLPCEEALMNSFLAQCLTDAGFSVDHTDGGVSAGGPGDTEAAGRASLVCFGQMSALLPPGPDLTPEYLSDYYDFLIGVAECAEDQGHIPDDPPTKESFVASGGSNWHPYQNLIGPEFADLERACPQDFRG